MSDAEGVIQYRLDYRPGALPPAVGLDGLLRWFQRCRELRLIGQSPERYAGYAYGNISVRSDRGFVISGTQTGGKPALTADDLAWVLDFDPAANHLSATGPRRPSSEAMTHGQVYRASPRTQAVIHVHSPAIWHQARALHLPTTPATAEYGTPQMAAAVAGLLRAQSDAAEGLFVMDGHADGVVAYAGDMDRAGERLLEVLARARRLVPGDGPPGQQTI